MKLFFNSQPKHCNGCWLIEVRGKKFHKKNLSLISGKTRTLTSGLNIYFFHVEGPSVGMRVWGSLGLREVSEERLT